MTAESSSGKMDNDEAQPETFVEMVLALLKDRFPWADKDEPATRAETVDQLSDWERCKTL
jgi:hypothetical protein